MNFVFTFKELVSSIENNEEVTLVLAAIVPPVQGSKSQYYALLHTDKKNISVCSTKDYKKYSQYFQIISSK